ncbi:MAG TPA: histidine kinase [Hyphomonadaceae bacterium]|nr:histidine kinase [Hyphomonadaceae bacterium]
MYTGAMIAEAGPSHAKRLDERLPPDVEPGGLSRFAAYQRYPVFTWPWFLRRAFVFWPFAAAYGAFLGVWHASSMGLWRDAIPLGGRGVLGFIVVVSAGPLIAMAIRYRRLPPIIEAILVVAAVGIGMAIGAIAITWVERYHDMLMGRQCCGSMHAPMAVQSISRLLGLFMGELPGWLGLFLVSGGLELPSYLGERRRIAGAEQQRAFSALRRDKAEADMRLTVLQAQVEPHFLFNTLASVRSLVRTDPERAEKTIEALSDYLRSTLPKLRGAVGLERSTLGEQVDICADYLELMKVRMDERISIAIDVAPDLRVLSFPPLLLISLAENAVKHGLEPKPGGGAIAIRARRVDRNGEQALEVAVEDDGLGLREGAGSGVGLANLREQLRHRFGERALLDVSNRETGGVSSRIIIPMEHE